MPIRAEVTVLEALSVQVEACGKPGKRSALPALQQNSNYRRQHKEEANAHKERENILLGIMNIFNLLYDDMVLPYKSALHILQAMDAISEESDDGTNTINFHRRVSRP